MSLTGPEIDLLLEVLADDPADEVYPKVARALAGRGDHPQAIRVLTRAFEHGADDPVDARLLASWAAEAGNLNGVGVALTYLSFTEIESDPVLLRARALHLDHVGDMVQAATLAERLLADFADDPALQAIIDRGQAAAPEPHIYGVDPFYTVGRAESYNDIGRPDLAIRTLRRILAHVPDDPAVHARLLQLRAQPTEPRPWVDDLSEEYWVDKPTLPLVMPSPGITPVLRDESPPDDDAPTVPVAPERQATPGASPHVHFHPPLLDDDDDAIERSAGSDRLPSTIPGADAARDALRADSTEPTDEARTAPAPPPRAHSGLGSSD